jgi:hypothetical protein
MQGLISLGIIRGENAAVIFFTGMSQEITDGVFRLLEEKYSDRPVISGQGLWNRIIKP